MRADESACVVCQASIPINFRDANGNIAIIFLRHRAECVGRLARDRIHKGKKLSEVTINVTRDRGLWENDQARAILRGFLGHGRRRNDIFFEFHEFRIEFDGRYFERRCDAVHAFLFIVIVRGLRPAIAANSNCAKCSC